MTQTTATSELLRVENLSVNFGTATVIEDLSFTVRAGRTTAVVGESGSGKSVTSMSIMRLADIAGASFPQGRIMFLRDGGEIDLLARDQKAMRKIRGNEIAMIFQEPMTSLNPVFTVGDQLAEVLMLHEGMSKDQALVEAERLLTLVRLPDAMGLITRHPHQLSGGMRQRAVIATALIANPELIIADEVTSALDVTVQRKVLDILLGVCADRGAGVIMITHDLGVVAQCCDRVAVLYGGMVAEEADVYTLFDHPRHPYTQALMRSMPRIGDDRPFQPIPGSAAQVLGRARHCPFAPRCSHATARCLQEIPRAEVAGGSTYRCFNPLMVMQ